MTSEKETASSTPGKVYKQIMRKQNILQKNRVFVGIRTWMQNPKAHPSKRRCSRVLNADWSIQQLQYRFLSEASRSLKLHFSENDGGPGAILTNHQYHRALTAP